MCQVCMPLQFSRIYASTTDTAIACHFRTVSFHNTSAEFACKMVHSLFDLSWHAAAHVNHHSARLKPTLSVRLTGFAAWTLDLVK